jgi:hypothetical protein|tara:strand:- start:868 stop:1272 length:405 start_codon:yes stop_codon:yes gene_type:complete
MTALSSYSERKVLDLLFKNTAFTAPEAYIGLFTSDPTDSASGTEASGSGYARIRIDNKMASATTGSDNSSIVSNTNITFAAASGGDFGTITHIGIFDALTSGNLLAHGALTASKTISDGDTFQINSGNLTITID